MKLICLTYNNVDETDTGVEINFYLNNGADTELTILYIYIIAPTGNLCGRGW